MGIFDYVLIEGHQLPGIEPERLERAHREGSQVDLAGKPVVFQMKDLETYIIKDGRLYEWTYEHEDVPEEERPYYGKDFYRRSGSRKVVGHHDNDLEYHGDLVFYTTKKDLRLAEEYGTGLVDLQGTLHRRCPPVDQALRQGGDLTGDSGVEDQVKAWAVVPDLRR